MANRKHPSEIEIIAEMSRPGWGLTPLRAEVETRGMQPKQSGSRSDALVTLRWGTSSYRFAVEIKSLWTPKSVLQAIDQATRAAQAEKRLPMIVVPYLGKEQLKELESRGVSGIDLCGNGLVVVPEELLVLREGNPNRFRFEGTIKNVYRGASSLVARAILLEGRFQSIGEALERIKSLGGEVTLSTVSKVCKALEDDLIIERSPGELPTSRSLRLLQPEKLLDLLRANYARPRVTGTWTGKYTGTAESLTERLADWEAKTHGSVVRTGATSVSAYALMVREPVQEFYCSNLHDLQEALNGLIETDRFPNLRLTESRDSVVYFDRRPHLMASPLQTYLELATGDKRDQETADQVRRLLLRPKSARGH